MRLRTSLETDRDFIEIHTYGSEQFGVDEADAYLDSLQDACERFLQFPEMGRAINDLRPQMRMFRFRSHLVFYRVLGDEILIVRILHGSAHWIKLL